MQNDLSVKVMASTDMGPEGNIGKSTSSFLQCFCCQTANRGCEVEADLFAKTSMPWRQSWMLRIDIMRSSITRTRDLDDSDYEALWTK